MPPRLSLKQVSLAHDPGVDLTAAQTELRLGDLAADQRPSPSSTRRAGATNADLIAAQGAVDQARNGLTTAQAKLDLTMAGCD